MNPAKPASIVAVMAHPDDAEIWAGGTLALHAIAGAEIAVVVPRHEDETRNREAARSAEIIGAALHQPDQLTGNGLAELLVTIRTHVVVTHPLRDVHPDHRRVAELVMEALPDTVIACGHPRRAYTCDTYNSLTLDGPVPGHTVVDITSTYDTKMRALAAHTTQPIDQHFAPMADTLTRLWGARSGVARAEAFNPLPILGRLSSTTSL